MILCGIAFVLCYWCRGQWHNWCSLRLGTEAVQYAPSILGGSGRTGLDVKMLCTHTRLTHTFNGPLSRTTRVSRYQKGKPIWTLLKQETVSGSGISWAICKSAPRSRQITTPAPHHSEFYRPYALPAAQPTASKLH